MRKQYFVTAGIFHRADACCGFQWGIAYDFLHDIYYQNSNLQQIRSETSYVIDDVYEVGYYGAYGVGTDRVFDGQAGSHRHVRPLRPPQLRERRRRAGMGRRHRQRRRPAGRRSVGSAGKGFCLGEPGQLHDPQARPQVRPAQAHESWGLVAQLVWYPGQNARCQQQNPYRPMFNVADNSLFMSRLAQ